jgi:hypothetical protein
MSSNDGKFKLNYYKTKPIDLQILEKQYSEIQYLESLKTKENDQDDKEETYQPYRIKKIQQYNPIYNLFFELNENNYNDITFNHKYFLKNLFEVMDLKTHESKNQNVFIKFSPLLDPIRYMTGKYEIYGDKINVLPNVKLTENDCIPKLVKYSNASYVDNFFYFLSSILLNEHDFIHGINYFGSFLGIQEKFKINVEDDIEYLSNHTFFNNNIGKLFRVENNNQIHNDFSNYGSKNNKHKLNIIEEYPIELVCDLLSPAEFLPTNLANATPDVTTTDAITDAITDTHTMEIVYENTTLSSSDNSENSEQNYSSDEETDDSETSTENSDHAENNDSEETEDDSEEEWGDDETDCSSIENHDVHAYINNFPIQMICLEKCDGTLDELFDKELMNEENGSSMLFQIIMTLILYQKTFKFTHNDLHTNNIMFVNTDAKYLYYIYNKTYYRVPTHGRIFKIIDFGRAIYKFNGCLFCSDSFALGGDASTQYNFEPFFNQNKPRLEPNYSFDLCRLACSIYDFIIDDNEKYDDMDEFQKIIYNWCLDDGGKNILYKKNGEERYPNFKLYKMIARGVHNKEPQEQIKLKIFEQYEFLNNKKNLKILKKAKIMNIDDMQVYSD